jgi:hypothetical protein
VIEVDHEVEGEEVSGQQSLGKRRRTLNIEVKRKRIYREGAEVAKGRRGRKTRTLNIEHSTLKIDVKRRGGGEHRTSNVQH